MKWRYSLLFLLSLLSACSSNNGYLRWVGDIPADRRLDDPDFQLCHGDQFVRQYFHMNQGGLQYEGEKPAIVAHFRSGYQAIPTTESGLIRIRFIVNCQGEAGRFRMIQADDQYQEFVFDERITSQLLSLTQKMEGWPILPNEAEPRDYYQYLIFKIEKGQLKEIIP